LNSGDVTEVDDIDGSQVGNGSGVTDTTLATVTEPTWPVETDLIYVAGTNKVMLSLQSYLLHTIFHDTFDNVCCKLLTEHAFPDAVAIPKMLTRCILDAAKTRMTFDGQYNASAACVHQRLLSNNNYLTKMIRLVSDLTSSTTWLIIISAACTHSYLPSRD